MLWAGSADQSLRKLAVVFELGCQIGINHRLVENVCCPSLIGSGNSQVVAARAGENKWKSSWSIIVRRSELVI